MTSEPKLLGEEMWGWAKDLFPICRSITGPGVRQTLTYFQRLLPKLKIHEVPSGTQAFDWTVPDEWTIRDAYVLDEFGKRVIDFKQHNLHVVGYSEPIDLELSRDELDQHLYSLPDQPTAIPYVTSYYKRRWGFCVTHEQRESLRPGLYRAVVDANLTPGVLNYAELFIPSTEASSDEILLSTYICHPSMANNELSGPVVTAAIARWLSARTMRRYSYRIVFVPETIGSLVYISRNLDQLKLNVIAGYNISCVGDDRAYSYLPSRQGDSMSDVVAQHVLHWTDANYQQYTWADRGSDERQYCAPGIDLPIASIMRTKFGDYPEYHTSLDDLDTVVTPRGLEGGFRVLQRALVALEANCYPKGTVMGEPQLGKRGLYPTLSIKGNQHQVRLMMDLLSWSDGEHDLITIADKCACPIWELYPLLERLSDHGLLNIR